MKGLDRACQAKVFWLQDFVCRCIVEYGLAHDISQMKQENGSVAPNKEPVISRISTGPRLALCLLSSYLAVDASLVVEGRKSTTQRLDLQATHK